MKNQRQRLAGHLGQMAYLIGAPSHSPKVVGLSPSQRTYLGWGFQPRWKCVLEVTDGCLSVSLKSIHISSGEDFKKCRLVRVHWLFTSDWSQRARDFFIPAPLPPLHLTDLEENHTKAVKQLAGGHTSKSWASNLGTLESAFLQVITHLTLPGSSWLKEPFPWITEHT